MKTISGIEFASEHNGTDVFRVIELAYEQGRKDGHSEQLGTNLAEVGTDCISRQAAIDGINELMKVHFDRKFVLGKARTIMQELPPADPQIIRCKDCKNWDTTWTNDFSPNYHYCPMVDGVRKEDWFCADAERRTDE